MTTRTKHHSNNTKAADVPSAPPETHQRAAFPAKAQHEIGRVVLDATMIELRPFVSEAQFDVLANGCQGEESTYFGEAIVRLAGLIRTMPKTWDQRLLGDSAVVYLHYFLSGSDWYILEKDIEGGVDQAFGFTVLNGDEQCAELGYISIVEITNWGAELNLHFQLKTLASVKWSRQQDCGQ